MPGCSPVLVPLSLESSVTQEDEVVESYGSIWGCGTGLTRKSRDANVARN